ncbi:hypothetical protein ASG43_17385 [Aureimonas sp. Leaf454]|nr:hypothetical protein ASG43_17385 [Aureimonas sp. Leaf454]
MAAASATVLFVVLFLRAAFHKASDLVRFQGYVDDYALLPEPLVEPVAKGLVAAELLTVALLVVPMTVSVGAAFALALLLVYAGGIAINLKRGRRRIECGCGGPAQMLSAALVLRNGLLGALALLPLVAGFNALSLGEAAAAVSSGLLLVLFVALAEQLLANDGHVQRLRASLSGKGAPS